MTETQRPAPQPPDIGRRTLTPFGYGVAIVVPLLIAAIGLVVLHFNYDQEDLVDGKLVPVLTSEWEPGDPGSDALLSGELVLDGGCVLVGETFVVWPRDYEVSVQRVGPTDQVKVYDAERDIVARTGNALELGGGYVPVGEYAGRPCAPGSGDVFVIQSEVTVVSQP